MDNCKSYEFTFLYLINKCILLFKYINNNYQNEILYEIKNFINKLQEIFSNADFKNNEDKKNKILEILIDYFEKIIDEKIYNLIDDINKDNIIIEIEKNALLICENNEKKLSKKYNEINNFDKPILKKYEEIKEVNELKEIKENNSLKNNNYSQITLIEFEQKINNKIKVIFSEIENNIRVSLKDYFDHTKYVEI